ncbi:hypothetical protein C8R43DRAFT_1132520 [Mycena crocata]|nr:hypothetical protein C8R43DRAFT_1132520 [Mycena crocata]
MISASFLQDAPAGSSFPPELERIIFEISALNSPAFIPPLTMGVAWRVKHWVESFMYRTVLLTSNLITRKGLPHCSLDILAHASGRMPPNFLRDAVRNVYLSYAPSLFQAQIVFALAACIEVTNLALALTLSLQDVPALGNLTPPPPPPEAHDSYWLSFRGNGTRLQPSIFGSVTPLTPTSLRPMCGSSSHRRISFRIGRQVRAASETTGPARKPL